MWRFGFGPEDRALFKGSKLGAPERAQAE